MAARPPDLLPIHRVGIGTDLHRLGAARPLRLGGIDVPHESGFVAHSDGDVVLHALIDALFGAAGLPDIGDHFPDSDSRYAGADSRSLLGHCLAELCAAGWQVVNVDVTIEAERPRLSGVKPAIRASLAELLGLPASAVAVKAKSREGLDAIGRGEAIACVAVAGLNRCKEEPR